jgi:tetratricopeptide (TPR) repeat protein
MIGIVGLTLAGLAMHGRHPALVLLPPMKTQPLSSVAPVAAEVAPPPIAAPVAAAQTTTAGRETTQAQPATANTFAVQAADYLLDPQAAYARRREFLGRLRQENQLTGVVADLEKRAAADPENPAIPATLGQAYLLQASLATNSIAEQGMLGLKADQTFDRALGLDANDWEARYWKAVAMAHWPSALGKSHEVMENFVRLVEQQEAQPPQPQFAETYSWLGKEYARAGYPDYARQAWERGLVFFPNQEQLMANLKEAQK